jgi:L-amino acid N-acyltransferase YncA
MIRLATPRDAHACREIYGPVVSETAISFENEVPSVEEMERRIAATLERLPWLIHETPAGVDGYAYAGAHRPRHGYRWSAEVSVYVAASARGEGVGRRLYAALLALLRSQGYVNVFAGIALPNAASVGLHEAMGFERIGLYRQVGFKLGRWVDVGWWQLQLREPPGEPEPPRSLAEAARDGQTPGL